MSITRDDVLTVADVAALLDLKPYTVKEYARRGILPGRKLGRNWRFLRPELKEAIKRLPQSPGH
jgi:excisionase family DNA binding protein